MEASTWANLLNGIVALAASAALFYSHRGATAARGQLDRVTADASERRAREIAEQARKVFWRQEVVTFESVAGPREVGVQFFAVNTSEEPIMAVLAAGKDPLNDEVSWVAPVGVLWPEVEQLMARGDYSDVPRPVGATQERVKKFECPSATFWKVILAFRDASGTWWIRNPDMTLEKFEGLPGNSRAEDEEFLREMLESWL